MESREHLTQENRIQTAERPGEMAEGGILCQGRLTALEAETVSAQANTAAQRHVLCYGGRIQRAETRLGAAAGQAHHFHGAVARTVIKTQAAALSVTVGSIIGSRRLLPPVVTKPAHYQPLAFQCQHETINTVYPAYVRPSLVDSQIAAQNKKPQLSEQQVIEQIMLAPCHKKPLLVLMKLPRQRFFYANRRHHITVQTMVLNGGWTAR